MFKREDIISKRVTLITSNNELNYCILTTAVHPQICKNWSESMINSLDEKAIKIYINFRDKIGSAF